MICYINLLTGEEIEFPNAGELINYLKSKRILDENGKHIEPYTPPPGPDAPVNEYIVDSMIGRFLRS